MRGERSRDPKVGAARVTRLGMAPARAAIPLATFRQVLPNDPDAVRQRTEPLIRRLDLGAFRPGGTPRPGAADG
ncbi:MAG TPA: hypothetical protein VFF52_24410 [Isosphaeraceae bacterium]|nr:hypothetical protein [Isosphaeraceae bacterium]